MEFNPPCGKQWISDLITSDKRYFHHPFFFFLLNFFNRKIFPKLILLTLKKKKKKNLNRKRVIIPVQRMIGRRIYLSQKLMDERNNLFIRHNRRKFKIHKISKRASNSSALIMLPHPTNPCDLSNAQFVEKLIENSYLLSN